MQACVPNCVCVGTCKTWEIVSFYVVEVVELNRCWWYGTEMGAGDGIS